MCLAIPGKIIEIDTEKQQALIDYEGLQRPASLMLYPQAQVDDYALVHAGFVIQLLDADYGAELTELVKEAGFYGDE